MDSADAIVVALKSRMAPHREAVAQSLSTLNWLLAQGADRIYFKYCSTFDSTPDGNIGPVLDALADALGVSTVITTPSSPGHHRTQYQGYLFVDDLLLSDSHMATHPVNPMTESSLRKLLGAQTKHSVGLIAGMPCGQGLRRCERGRPSRRRTGIATFSSTRSMSRTFSPLARQCSTTG